ncbi:MAG: ABC transporter ATP-binding protein [Phycisphaerales bacterium]
MSALLEVRGVTMRFGGLVANENVNLAVQPGEIFAVIGPNGAGKTTLFNAITGIYEPTEGAVLFEGSEIRRRWNAGVLLRALAVGALSAVVAALAINATAVWQSAVVDRYVYGQAFPWEQVPGAVWGALVVAGLLGAALPAVVGFAVGALAYCAIWDSQRRTPDLVARAGIARTFQNIRLFPEMNLVENVLVGMDQHYRCGFWSCLLRPPWFWRERNAMRARAFELLRFVELERSAGDLARNLPYGHQRRLEIARALATQPKLILLDEPAAGMNPSESADLMKLIRRIRERGVTVVLIEHDMKVVMGISDRVAVLQFGRKIAEGTPEQIRADPVCIEAYLGTEVLG